MTWTLLIALAALAAFLAWDRARRPAYHGTRFFRANQEEADANWCLARCEALAGVRCYDEETLCRLHLSNQQDCTIDHLRTHPWLVWRYQCIVASLGRAPASDGIARVPTACLVRCF